MKSKNAEFHQGMETRFRGKTAYLVECINEDSPEDINIQGKRWYVDSAGFRWSVTESELLSDRYQKAQ